MKIKAGILLCILPILFSCASTGTVRHPVESTEYPAEYRSELADPHAKAMFAFSQFRLFGGENRWEEAISALERAIAFDPESDYLLLILAKAYLHRDAPEKAAEILRKLLGKSPDHAAGHELLGDLYSFQKKYLAAGEHFRRALELMPASEQLQMRLAMTLAHLEQKDEAITILEDLLERHPAATGARLVLARLYLERDNTGKAMATYRQVLEQEPGQQQAVLEYGKLLEQQDATAALELYQNALVENPLAATVRQRLGQLFLSRQQFDEALEQFQAVRRQYPVNSQIISRIALIQLELEHWTEAESDFRSLIKASDEHQDHNYYYLAMALSGQEKTAEAIRTLKLIADTSAIYPDALLQLAYLYDQTAQQFMAIDVLKKALAEGIDRTEIYYYLAAFLGEQKEYAEAVNIVIAGVEKHPENVRLLYQQGILYEHLEDHLMAVQTIEKILALDADHVEALNFLAYHQAEEEIELDLALSRARKALEIKPSGYIVDTLGWIFFKMGRYAESREQLEEAVRLHPDDAIIMEHLGDLYRAMKLWARAEESYRRALEIDPQAIHLKEKLESLLRGEDK